MTDEFQQMTDEEVLAAIVSEREARRLDRLDQAFAESIRRGLWMEPYRFRHHRSVRRH